MKKQQPKAAPQEGWAFLYNSPKWHYFDANGHSLCKKWMTFAADREQGNDGSPDNCKACKTALELRKTVNK
jgi:hypothetical protein